MAQKYFVAGKIQAASALPKLNGRNTVVAETR
jgi:hypothetical protein